MLEAAPLAAPESAPATSARAGVTGLGVALPDAVVGNDEIAARLGVDPEWIERRTGIVARRRLAAGERLTDLAVAAGRAALEDAGVAVAGVDAILVATFTPDELLPAAAPQVAAALGSSAAAIDVNAACVGFLHGLDLAAALVESGRAERVLLIGAEALSRVTDRDDRTTAALFGDAAGAVVVGAGGAGALDRVVLRSAGEHAALLTAGHAEQTIRMRGPETYLRAIATLTEATTDALAAAGLSADEVDLFVYHQANRRILRAVGQQLGLPAERVVDAIGELGNTSAASIPLALAVARDGGRLRPGMRVLLGATGAGFVYGAGVLTWG